MPLFSFGSSKPAVVPQQQVEGDAKVAPQVDVAEIARQVAAIIGPTIAAQQGQAATPPATVESDPDADADPADIERITRIARNTTATMSQPYMAVLDAALPGIIRNQVVGELTEGQRVIYERHKDEVDASINGAFNSQPARKADPEVHRRAIRMMFGNHMDEVETLVLERATAADLPPTFQFPGGFRPSGESQVQLTAVEQNAIEYFNSSAPQGKRDWTPESLAYYRDLKPTYLHEMVAEHKRKQAAHG